MRKITNLLVCLVLAVLASTNVAWGTILYAVDGNGNTVPGLVVIDSPSKFTEESYNDGTDFSFDPITLYAQNNGNYTFDGFYTDATCTNSAGEYNFVFDDEEYYSLEIDVPDGPYYAKFTCSGDCGGGSSFTPEYYKVKIVPRKHATGSSSMSNGGGRYYVSTTASTPSSSTWETTTSGWTSDAFETGKTNIVDFYLKAQNDDDYVFEGWYTDMSCKNLISTSASYHYTYTQADLEACDEGGDDVDDNFAPRRRNAKAALGTCPPVQFDLKSSSGTAVANTIYAKFRDAFEPDYYKVRAQVVSPDGNTGGQVYLCSDELIGDPDYTDDHYDSQNAFSSSREAKVSVYLYAKAKDGYEFVGWFADEACTTPLSFNDESSTEANGFHYYYTQADLNACESSGGGFNFDAPRRRNAKAESGTCPPVQFTTRATSGLAVTTTIYAKFRSLEPQTYYAKAIYAADAQKRGGYFNTNDASIAPRYTYEETNNVTSTKSSEKLVFPLSGELKSQAARGYKIPQYTNSKWELENATFSGASGDYSTAIKLAVTSAKTSSENPEIAIVHALYEEAATTKVTIGKTAGPCQVVAFARNYEENAEGTGLELKEFPLTPNATESTETSLVYDVYEGDTMYVTATPAEGWRFNTWYNKNGVAYSDSRPTCKITVSSAAGANRRSVEFDQLFKRYYTVSADATAGGSVHVNFTDTDLDHAATTASGNSWWRDEGTEGDTTVTVYYKAIPAAGYEFVQWEENGNPVAGADAEYSRTLTATGTDSENPTTLSLHAVFRQESADEAQVIGDVGKVDGEDQGDGVLFSGTFAEAYEFAKAGHTIVLSQNVTLAASVTIDKNITIDFNNFKLSGTTSALVTIPAGKTVIFEDNSAAGFGGIEVTVNTTEEASAVQVNGTLSFMRGVISCENTNTSTTAQIEAIAVKNGATLNMQGGTATANANQIAVGVSVEAGGTALLETGAVNATAGTKAYGVLSNAATTTTTWNIAINATVSGSSAEANGLRILNAHGTSATNVVSGGTTTATASAASAKAYAIYVENSPVTISGNMAAEASAVTTTNAFAVYVNGANADVTVETGRFKTNNTQDITAASGILTLEGGYYVHENGLAALKAVGVTKGEVPSGTKFHQEGYRFVLSNGDNPNYVVATANGKNFSTLEDAILYANNNAGIGMTILMKVPEYTLPAGTYTIPANATLLLPKDAEQTTPLPAIDRETSSGSKPSPSVYQTLTLASGAHLYVHGNIEVGGRQHIYGTPFTGCPVGPYCSLLSMESGSQITLSNGANLYAWGFVQGQGEIDVRRGGTVHEQFQISDFKGGSVTYSMNGNEYKTFPLMSYFIQNVEVGTTYRPGSHLLTYTGFVGAEVDGIKIIGIDGEAAMFVMKNEDDSEDTWVRKWYDVSTDQQVYEVNNAAHLSQLELNLVASFNSGNYDLPITNNMKIHLLSGEMEISEDVVALPGADIEVNKLSTLVIKAGKRVSMLDSNEWGNYLYNNALGRRIKFRPGGVPTVRDISSPAGIGDARLNIHGTVDVKGSLYTSAGGATIYSTNEDAGTIIFSTAVPTTESQVGMVGKVHKLDGDGLIKYGPDYSFITTSPAQLTNASGKTATSGLAAGTSYCYIDNAWRSMVVNGCTIYDEAPEPDVYYAKPKEFVALSSANEDVNHLYHSKDGSRTFIMAGDRDGNCQWWEVESVEGHDDLVHCTHPENDVYYYYNTSEDAWMEKRFSVTWQNWDGTEIETYEVRYGSQPKYLGSTPTREKTDYYTYDFAGWTPALTTVTDDATYTAQFSQTDRKYLVVFEKDGAELETQYLHMGEMPVCKTYSLNSNEEWKTAAGLPLSSVTGDVTYILNSRNVSGPFTITFVNWDGNVLQTLANVTSGTTPSYTGTTPVKPALRDENYTFSGWTPAIVAASADAVYTAQYEAQRVPVANDLLIGTNGTEDLDDAVTEKDNLIITSDGISSGQLLGASKLTLKGEAVFKLATTIPARTWYAVAAPWNVDVRTGIYANGSRLTVGRDFDIIEFDAEAYATGENGEKNRNIWKYVEENGGVMIPGKLYMVYLATAQTSLEFHKTTGSILTTALSLTTTGGNGDRANWNAIANPALYHANLGITVIEDNFNDVLQYTNGGYTPATASNMIVGKPIFVQVNNSQSTVIAAVAGSAGMPAYRRAPQTATDNRFVVEITRDGQMNDRIIVQTAEEKADEYVIGKDLAKMGVGTKAAQMWMERYNTQLCKNTLEMKGEQVDYPLNLYAPAAGEYILTAAQERGEATLYLTRNGQPVWNLSYGEYVLNLEKGTTTEYGLRLVSKVPQITTGIGNVQGEDVPCTKVLRDGVIYILRGNNVYTIDGQLVK